MASITLKKVNKIYSGGEQALFDCDLEIRDGEFMVLMGPSACGKSTLVRTIAGLEDATSGEIFIGDSDVTELSPRDRDVAMVFQNNSLDQRLTVFENMAYGLKLRKAPKDVIDARVNEAASIFGLRDVLSKRPKQLTVEQRQRVLLGRVIVREPKAFLLDEPLGGLNAALRAKMRAEIARLHLRFKKTFVYVTANRAEGMLLATRAAVLKDGFLQQVDTPQNLYDYPANLFVADYLGALGFVRGARLEKEGASFFLCFGGIRLPLAPALVSRIRGIGDYAGGRPLIAALRPEDVRVSAQSPVKGKVVSADGEEIVVSLGGLELGLRENAQMGAEIGLSVDGARLLLFDGETERSVLGKDGAYHAELPSDAAFVPPSPAEMKARAAKPAPKKSRPHAPRGSEEN